MALLKQRIQGSTLLETLIAIVLILVCFSIATLVMVNIMESDNGRLKFHAHLELQALYAQTMDEKTFINDTKDFENFSIRKAIEPYHDVPKLYKVTLTALSKNNQVIEESQHLIFVEKYDE